MGFPYNFKPNTSNIHTNNALYHAVKLQTVTINIYLPFVRGL